MLYTFNIDTFNNSINNQNTIYKLITNYKLLSKILRIIWIIQKNDVSELP